MTWKHRDLYHMTGKGSFTMEAAVVVPIVMVTFLAVIFAAFMVHDKTVMQSVSEYALLESADDLSRGMKQAEKNITELLDSRLLSASDIRATFQSRDNYAEVTCKATFHTPLHMAGKMLGFHSGQISVVLDASCLRGRPALLHYKLLLDGAQELLGQERTDTNQ